MAPHYQATTLIASPSYPDAITWSSDNLVAVASGHIVTILNPAALDGPRGLVVLRPRDPFPIGVVNREDLFEPSLVPTSLARDTEPCARCLLAVCTVDGHVNLYRPPVSEFCDDWVKVADISQLLFNYYQNINFGEDDGPDSFPQEKANIDHAPQEKLNNKHTLDTGYADELQEPLSRRGPGRRKRKPVRVEGYVYDDDDDGDDTSKDADFSLNPCPTLTKIPMKKIEMGACYRKNTRNIFVLKTLACDLIRMKKMRKNNTVILSNCHPNMCDSGKDNERRASRSSLLLVTGCSDGSVKIWSGDIEGLNQCTDAKEVSFSLVAEVTTNSSAPVSSISLSTPAQPRREVNLAVGRVSGSLETWILDLCSNKVENSSECHAHDRVLSVVSHQCFGLTLAPGEVMIAVVRSLDPNMLDQMYQARTQKAVVEFIWIGGQFLGIPLNKDIYISNKQSAKSSETNFLWWGSNILWSLKNYEKCETGLVLWDVIAALQVLMKSAPAFLETLMHKWVSDLFSDDQQRVSIDNLCQCRKDMMSNVSSRKLHLLNIICRKVMLRDPAGENGNRTSTDLWSSLLLSSERELRERLVAFTFAAVLNRKSYFLKGTCAENMWFPVGVAQMRSWVSMNSGGVHNQLRSLSSTIKRLGSRINSVCEYSAKETCAYCSAPVHFESPDIALCGSVDPAIVPTERHKLSRCAASMRLCSVLEPTWYCVCCGGMVDKLVPETYFTMKTSPLLDAADPDDESSLYSAPAVPRCPFCGILLQRLMPEFLLSVSPV
ncbi:unnamed protein product [Triticum turgidum subsp. durum]|uniref:Transcription factor IIIC 90kDa subunit N-terminal domain-containing protein n=1 Tax=Triticum turgidum subsp. durum TaxID=4567 RepID=A0A9R0TEY6_TRITD|nr:unnamed protein product [Triticum turgidum subsp. durum]